MTSTDDKQSDSEADIPPRPRPRPRPRRRPPAWLVGVAIAVAAVVAATFLAGSAGNPPTRPRDLTTPRGAAEAFAQTAAAGDVEGVLAITCLGHAGCVAEHGGGVSAEQVDAARKVIADRVRDIGARLGHARFTAGRAGTEPGTWEVDYRLPGMPADERHYLVLVEYQDRWLYIATGGPKATS